MRSQRSLKSLVWAILLVLLTTLSVAADDDETIRIFRLVNADAEAMTNLVEHLSDGQLKLATDARTNSIVMVGSEEQAKVIEALLMKLDQNVEHEDQDEEEEEEFEEREWEEREHREMQMMVEREQRHHAEKLGHEIRRLEMKMATTKAEIEHQSKMMEFEVASAELMLQIAEEKVPMVMNLKANNKAQASDVQMAKLEAQARKIEVKRKSLQAEFFKSQAPMKLRELEFEIRMRHREMDGLGRHDDDHEHEEDRDEAHERDRDREHAEERERERDERRERGERRRDRDQATNETSPRNIADSQVTATPMFSGPQVGEKITPFEAKQIFGDRAGETVQVFAEEEKAPQLLVFVHQVTRPAIGLSRMLIGYAKKLEPKGLNSNVVFLSDDRTETEAWMKRAQHALPQGIRTLVSVDGMEGPGAYGLNRKAQVTILVCNEGKVTANFALGQPSINVDAPKIGHALVRAVGGSEKPSLKDMGFAGRGMRGRMNTAANPEQDAKYRSMMAPLIQKNASMAEVMEAAANIETYAEKHDWFRQRVEKAAGLIVNGGKLSNYGTPEAQEYLKAWADK